jgi:hypothetical protein
MAGIFRLNERAALAVACAISAVLSVGVLSADTSLQSVTITLPFQNILTSECLMATAEGTLGYTYGTAPTEGNQFVFHDPLPQGAILRFMKVDISSMASCQPSPGLSVKFNVDRPGVLDFFKDFGTLPQLRTYSCSAPPTRFAVGSVFAPNLVFPDPSLYIAGGDNVLSVTEVGDTCTPGNVRIGYVRVTLYYYESLPYVIFDPLQRADDAKVLMHRWRSDYDYLSNLQAAVQPPDNRDHNVAVRGTAYDATGAPFAGQTMYVRTADPPDPSQYLPAGMSHDGDNPTGWAGFPLPSDVWSWAAVTTDANGRFDVTMPVLPQFAGDNQEVEASAVPLPYIESPTRCKSDLGCSRSPIFTSWRRVFIERDRMFRKGAFIRADIAPGATQVPVTDGSPFKGAKASSPIPVLFIHSSALDPNGMSGAEVRNVIKVTGGRKSPTLVLDAPLTLAYVERKSSFDASLPSGDAVGVFNGDADVFPSYIDPSIEFFKDMYTDVRVLKDGTENVMQYIPFIAKCPSDDYCGEVVGIWFDNRDHDTSAKNHVHLVAAAADSIANTLGFNLMNGGVETYGWPQALFVFNASIQTAVGDASNTDVGGLDPVVVTNQITAHEIVHTFDVNPPARLTGGHCTTDVLNGWLGGHCLMNQNRDKADRGSAMFSLHVDPWTSSEYRRVRHAPEPLPLVFQHDVAPNP